MEAVESAANQRRYGKLETMSLVVPPYPPPRYAKDEPEVSAWLRRAPENGGEPPDYDSFGLMQSRRHPRLP